MVSRVGTRVKAIEPSNAVVRVDTCSSSHRIGSGPVALLFTNDRDVTVNY